MTPALILARLETLEAQQAAAAKSTAHNADTEWAVAEGEILELRAVLAKMEQAA